ncbi:hypothetical protein [Kitasatospora sp. NPDC085879]
MLDGRLVRDGSECEARRAVAVHDIGRFVPGGRLRSRPLLEPADG